MIKAIKNCLIRLRVKWLQKKLGYMADTAYINRKTTIVGAHNILN